MTHPEQHTAIQAALESLVEEGFDGMATAMQILFNEAMKIERSQFLRAEPHERTSEREGYANGFKPKSVKSRIGRLDLRIPQVRDTETPFYPRSLERGLRSERALKLAIAEMYVQGVSTRKVKEIAEQLCGTEINSTEVSRAAKLLDEELSAWRERELGAIKYLILDARYEKVRYAGSVVDCAVLIAMGVRADDGKRMILGTSVSLSEAEVHWRAFLERLQDRGMHGVKLVVSDDHKGLKAALKARLTGVTSHGHSPRILTTIPHPCLAHALWHVRSDLTSSAPRSRCQLRLQRRRAAGACGSSRLRGPVGVRCGRVGPAPTAPGSDRRRVGSTPRSPGCW